MGSTSCTPTVYPVAAEAGAASRPNLRLVVARSPFADGEIPILAPEHRMVCKAVFNRARDWVDIGATLTLGHGLEDDAAYGVDALNVDWNKQAAQKAAEYLDCTSFSRSGLIEQLVYEGFTQAQAEYGVSTTGL